MKRIFSILAILLVTILSSSAFATDNTIGDGPKKVEGGIKAVGKSAEEFGTKAGKAAEGAAKDSGSALGKAWDDIVKGVKKAFK